MALVTLNAVRKSFGSRTVRDGLDFAIEPRARVGVVGANGSGKSTMLRLVAGIEEPDAGTSARRRGIVVSFLPQHPLGDERNARETVRATRPDLDERWEAAGGPSIDGRARAMLLDPGIDEADLTLPTDWYERSRATAAVVR